MPSENDDPAEDDASSTVAWTIEELAAATDMTVRNVRAHQSRGLLQPPQVRGRVGYYGPDHLERLRMIRSMQEEGFNLSAIASVLAAGSETAHRVRRLSSPLLEELSVSPQAVLSKAGLEILLEAGEGVIATMLDAGVIRRLHDGRYAAATPAMLAAARRLQTLGVTEQRQATATQALLALAQDAAQSVVKLTEELCGAECEDPRVLDEARALVTEVYRAVLDRSIARHLDAAYR
jgi:DNA-binding transcriptional MerR regulator